MADKETALPEDIGAAHDMIRSLRKEAADKRVRLRQFEQAFDGFNGAEVSYLLDNVAKLGSDTPAGAVAFRDMAKDLLGDKFLEGIDLPAPAPAADESEAEGATDVKSLTIDEIRAELDRREAEKADSQSKAEEEAAIEAVFAEIEALGFERNSRAFTLMLQEGVRLANQGEAVDFGAIAPAVRAAAQALGEDVAEPETAAEPAEEAAPAFPKSGDLAAGGAAPTDGSAEGDWAAEAKAKGATSEQLMAQARERMEQRLGLV